MTTGLKKIDIDQVLNALAGRLKQRQYSEAAKLSVTLLQLSQKTSMPLIMQRYFSELAMECSELDGKFDVVLEYLEQALQQYKLRQPDSQLARRDYYIICMRRAFVLLKQGQTADYRTAIDQSLTALSPSQASKLKPVVARLKRFSPAALGSIEKEQRQLGLFYLTEQLMQQGANTLKKVG